MIGELEREIAATPEDPRAYLVLADALMAAGDPLGELIAVQHRRSGAPDDAALARRERELLDEHAGELFGALAASRATRTPGLSSREGTWFMGHLRSVRLEGGADTTVAVMLTHLGTLPIARFLRQLSFGRPGGDELYTYDELTAALARTTWPCLREVFYGDDLGDGGHWNWLYELGRVEPVYACCPRLEVLRLHGGSVDLGSVDAPRLRMLEISLGAAHDDRALVRQVAGASAPMLERLQIDFGGNSALEAEAELFAPIIDGSFARLTSLSLGMIRCGPALVAALVESPLAPRLVRLELRFAGLVDRSAELLMVHQDRFESLVSLDVSDNYLSADAARDLQDFCSEVEIGNQEVSPW